MEYVQSPSAVHGGLLFSSLLYYSYYLFLGNFKFWLITVTTWISFEYVRFINKKSSIKRLRLLILYSILMSPYFFLSNAHLVRQMFALAVYLFALRRQSKLSFILFSIFSVLIHNTIIYFIFVEYIVEKIAVKWFKYLAIIGFLIAIQNIIFGTEAFPILSNYRDNDDTSSAVSVIILLSYVPIIFSWKSMLKFEVVRFWILSVGTLSFIGIFNSLIYYRLSNFILPLLFTIPIFALVIKTDRFIEITYMLFLVCFFFYTISRSQFQYTFFNDLDSLFTIIPLLKLVV